jgi:hypothetical protein
MSMNNLQFTAFAGTYVRVFEDFGILEFSDLDSPLSIFRKKISWNYVGTPDGVNVRASRNVF